MQRVLSAFFAPEVLGWVLLAAAGVFVFLLLRPREQDAPEEIRLEFLQQRLRIGNPEPKAERKPEARKTGGADQASGGSAAGFSGI